MTDRTALAPLEMVLALPLLMGIMGLLMVFGFVASWKVRSEVVARDVGWRIRNPRSGGLHQRSDEWPELQDIDRHLGLRVEAGRSLQSVDAQAIVHAPIIRGPIPEINVNSNLLDLSRNVTRGVSSVDQPSQIMGEIGRVNYETTNEFLSEEFKYSPMGVGNWNRRIPILWNTELDVVYDNSSVNGLMFAMNELRDPIVMPIDEDMDFYYWNLRLLSSRYIDERGVEHTVLRKWGSVKPNWPYLESFRYITDYTRLSETDFDVARQRPKSFRPRENLKEAYYEEGQQKIRESIVESYLYQIPQRPLSMAQATKRLYEEVLDASEDDLVEPRLTVQEKNQLEDWVSDLEEFIAQLQEERE